MPTIPLARGRYKGPLSSAPYIAENETAIHRVRWRAENGDGLGLTRSGSRALAIATNSAGGSGSALPSMAASLFLFVHNLRRAAQAWPLALRGRVGSGGSGEGHGGSAGRGEIDKGGIAGLPRG